jgi:cyclic 2,3-diphosphoglycerate synthase
VREGPVIALIDGEHHPPAVREALAELDASRGVAATVFCGGEEKLTGDVLAAPERHYGRHVVVGEAPAAALGRLAPETGAAAVVDLADEPILPPPAKLALAAVALHLGLAYEAPGLTLPPPSYEPVAFDGAKLAVIGTGKRTGKTAVAGHLATLLRDRGTAPVIVSMGRGGPAEPQVAAANTGVEDLERIASGGDHAASDYLEDSALAGVPAIGCRRVGGGLAGEPWASTVRAGAELAASLNPRSIVFEGSGGVIPPVEVDATVCVVGDRRDALEGLGPYRLLRADLALVMEGAGSPGEGAGRPPGNRAGAPPGEARPGGNGTMLDAEGDRALADEVAAAGACRTVRCALRPEPGEELPAEARIALFSTGAGLPDGFEPVVASANLARREALRDDLAHAARERCDVYLTELKAAAIDTVAAHARAAGARVVFVRNRPVGLDGADLDRMLVELVAEVER